MYFSLHSSRTFILGTLTLFLLPRQQLLTVQSWGHFQVFFFPPPASNQQRKKSTCLLRGRSLLSLCSEEKVLVAEVTASGVVSFCPPFEPKSARRKNVIVVFIVLFKEALIDKAWLQGQALNWTKAAKPPLMPKQGKGGKSPLLALEPKS